MLIDVHKEGAVSGFLGSVCLTLAEMKLVADWDAMGDSEEAKIWKKGRNDAAFERECREELRSYGDKEKAKLRRKWVKIQSKRYTTRRIVLTMFKEVREAL